MKLFGIGAAGLAAGALLKERPVDKLLAGVVIAGSAHLVNLLDVRPGRAVGAVLALGAPGLLRRGPAGPLSAAPIGAAAAVLGDDLGERTMIGDAGAHALGAALGLAIVTGNDRRGLAAHAAGLIAAAAAGPRQPDSRSDLRREVRDRGRGLSPFPCITLPYASIPTCPPSSAATPVLPTCPAALCCHARTPHPLPPLPRPPSAPSP